MFQTKNISKEVQEIDEKGIVAIYVNAFNNLDYDRDISLPGSFKKTIKENKSRIKHFLNHSWTNLIGVPVEMKENDTGLLVRSKLNMNKQLAKDTYEDYKLFKEQGVTLEHSIGFDIVKSQTDEEKEIREIQEYKLWEYSTLTGWGANENTPLVDIKGMHDVNDLLAALEKMLTANYSDERKRKAEKLIIELKTLMEPQPSTPTEPFDAMKYLKDNLILVKN